MGVVYPNCPTTLQIENLMMIMMIMMMMMMMMMNEVVVMGVMRAWSLTVPPHSN